MENLLIHGQAPDALEGLGQFDLIYIDPPCNSSNIQDYPNRWKGPVEEYPWAGDHGEFLSYVLPAIQKGAELLSDEGMMFISMSEKEIFHLKVLLDQVLGHEKFLGSLVWDKGHPAGGSTMASIHETVLIYGSKKSPKLRRHKPGADMLLDKASELRSMELYHEEAERQFKRWLKRMIKRGLVGKEVFLNSWLHPVSLRPFRASAAHAQTGGRNRSKRAVIHPLTNLPCRVPSKGWRYNEESLSRIFETDETVYATAKYVVQGKAYYGPTEATIPRLIQYLDEKKDYAFPSIVRAPSSGKRELPHGVSFSSPKPIKLIKEILSAYGNPSARVLDFYAGSGSTAHAVHELNHRDGGNRRWVLVEKMHETIENVIIPRLKSIDAVYKFISHADRTPAN